jgi:hypothetical protein
LDNNDAKTVFGSHRILKELYSSESVKNHGIFESRSQRNSLRKEILDIAPP